MTKPPRVTDHDHVTEHHWVTKSRQVTEHHWVMDPLWVMEHRWVPKPLRVTELLRLSAPPWAMEPLRLPESYQLRAPPWPWEHPWVPASTVAPAAGRQEAGVGQGEDPGIRAPGVGAQRVPLGVSASEAKSSR